MARQLPAGCLTAAPGDGHFAYRAAGNADAEAINALLAATPLGGGFAVTMERAPDPLQAGFGLSSNHLIVLGHDRRSGELAGMCERTVYPAFVNGAASALPYLGALRVAPAFRNRLRVVRGGFEAVRRLGDEAGELPFALTSITADNARAMRLLTAGLPGLPRYRPAGAYSTLVLRARRRRVPPAIRRASAADLPAIAALLNRENARVQFAPVWTPQSLASLSAHGLAPGIS
ncbi:MAG: hypothetical protein H6891_12085 [Brucellaceae bacterium]|nr:hypothetical protein [Brucellaceae bacterium]